MHETHNNCKPNTNDESAEKKAAVQETSATVLVAEDNFLNQKVTVILLDRLGLKATVVATGLEAVDAVNRQKFSLILMDCHMPNMDGFEASGVIRKLEELNGTYTPIIALTALAMPGDYERCVAAGMDDYISKPIDRALLKTKLDYWIRKNQAVNEQRFCGSSVSQKSTLAIPDVDSLNIEELEEFYGREQLKQMLALFSSDAMEPLERIETFIRDRNAGNVTQLAHELRACCASIGAKKMFKSSLTLEQAATREDWKEVESCLNCIKVSFRHLEDFRDLLMTA